MHDLIRDVISHWALSSNMGQIGVIQSQSKTPGKKEKKWV